MINAIFMTFTIEFTTFGYYLLVYLNYAWSYIQMVNNSVNNLN